MKYLFTLIICLGLVILSCGSKKETFTVRNGETKDSLRKKSFISEEIFEDSISVGEKGKNKVKIEKFRSTDENEVFVNVEFYRLNEYFKDRNKDIKWYKTQKFYFEKDDISGIDANNEDINNDGINDFSYQSTVAARGGNEVRRWFIYNSEDKDFVLIKNSEDYPNMYLNKELNCINSFILTGSTATVFLRHKKDSLQEFARVEVSDSIYVSELGKDGKMHLIHKEKYNDGFEDFYTPFIDYKPLKFDKNIIEN